MQTLASIPRECLFNLLGIFAQAARALPFIALLGLVPGQRAYGRLCLFGGARLFALSGWLAICAILAFSLAYIFQIQAFGGLDLWRPLFTAAGLPFLSSILAACTGMLAALATARLLEKTWQTAPSTLERYSISLVRKSLPLGGLAAICLFATFILINWPFAGLPQNLGWQRAIMAIFRNALSHYIIALAPAGVIGLVFAWRWLKNAPFPQKQKVAAIRWLAAWAAIGYLPYLLQNWGVTIGLGLRGPGAASLVGGLGPKILDLGLCTGIMACAFWLLFCKKPKAIAIWLTFGLLLLKALAPGLARYFMA